MCDFSNVIKSFNNDNTHKINNSNNSNIDKINNDIDKINEILLHDFNVNNCKYDNNNYNNNYDYNYNYLHYETFSNNSIKNHKIKELVNKIKQNSLTIQKNLDEINIYIETIAKFNEK